MMFTLKKEFVLWCILLITFFSFFPVLSHELTNYDDHAMITENLMIAPLNLETIKKIFTNAFVSSYVPVTVLSFAVEYHFFGSNSFIYHFNNLLLHLVIVGLIFFLGLRLGLTVLASGIAALLFGVHPLHVESVAWVTERKGLLYSFFYILAMRDYWIYIQTQNEKNYFLSLAWGLLSILSKPMALSLPLILLLLDWWHKRKWSWKLFIEKIPFVLLIIPIVWQTFKLYESHGEGGIGLSSVLIFIWTFIFYLAKLFWPIELTPVYQLPKAIEIFNIYYILPTALLVLCIGLIIYFRRYRWFIFSWVFYCLSIFFILRFRDMESIQMLNVVADRFMYLPSLGFCFFIGWVIEEGFKKKYYLAAGLVVLIFIFLSIKTFSQCLIWKDSLTLWNYAIAKAADVPYVYNNRGTTYMNLGKFDLAMTDFDKALSLKLNFDKPHFNKATIFSARGDLNAALREVNLAIEIDGDDADSYFFRADLYQQMNRCEDAIKDYEEVLKWMPGTNIYNNRALCYDSLKKFDLAIDDYNKALGIAPVFQTFYNRGLLHMKMGELDLALRDFTKAIELNDQFLKSYNQRGIIYTQSKKYDLAISDFSRVLTVEPKNATVYYNRSKAYAADGQLEQSLADVKKAQELGYSVSNKLRE